MLLNQNITGQPGTDSQQARKVVIRLPLQQMRAAQAAISSAHDEVTAIEAERASLGTIENARIKGGEDGVTRYNEASAALEQRRDAATRAALEAVEAQARAAQDMLDEQVTPDGNDIIGENAADFALLEHNLIANAAQLERILAKHDNVAFRQAAAQYAARKEWDGFDAFALEKTAREYTGSMFDGLKAAASNPTGPAYMQYVDTPHEYARIANNYGLSEEYAASDPPADM